ncbi:transposase [Streptomyces sp. NPDC050610]|uniref:transposase n=1 Tax=Streptomyces sp. NPDC050610 TaxID=3157097 RepID=UPI003418CE04
MPEEPEPDALLARPDTLIVLRHRERHAAVHALMARGAGVTRIAAELRLDPKTVRKFMRADTIDDFLAAARGERPQNLDRHAEYLVMRFNEGCTRADILHAELAAQGVHVSSRTVRRFVHRLRREPPMTFAAVAAPKATAVIKALLSHPDGCAEEDNLLVKEVCTRSPEMETAHSLIGGFATMMQNRWGITHLDAWLTRCEGSDLPELETLARGLRQDQDAVRAGLSLEWNSGKVEGNVNRLKMLKRQTYGRARLALLAQRVTQH